MSDQGKRLLFLIQLMLSDSQAKNSSVESDELFCPWQNFLPTVFLPTKFYTDYFSSDKVSLIRSFYYFFCKRDNIHCVKSVRIRSYSGPHFPAFGLNTEKYSVNVSVFSSNAGKWLLIQTYFTQWLMLINDRPRDAISAKCFFPFFI